jgi:hypothetical protein
MRWAGNSSSVAPPKHATRQQYKQATALEALVRQEEGRGGGLLLASVSWAWQGGVSWGCCMATIPNTAHGYVACQHAKLQLY